MKLKARALVAVVAIALSGLVTMSPPASAANGVVVCAVAGFVNVNPGVGRIPPGSDTGGNYLFTQVALVCVGANDDPLPTFLGGSGTMTGPNTANSNGQFGQVNCGGVDYPLVGSFCGNYNTFGGPDGGSCSGTVGGNEMAMATEPPPGPPFGSWGDEDTIDEQIAAGDWSVTFGPLILGGITCTNGSYGPDGVGAIALVGIPLVTSMDGQVLGMDLPPGECAPPNRAVPPPPIPDPGDPAAVWFCDIVVAGVAVMESVGATGAAMSAVDLVTDNLPPILP